MSIPKPIRILVWLIIWLAACNVWRPQSAFEAVNFPLVQQWAATPTRPIYGIAVSDDWIAVGRPNGITAIDANSGEILWEMNSRLDNDSPLLFSKGFLATDSSSEIRIMEKSGKTIATVNLDPGRLDAKLVAAYDQYLFVVRIPSWTLEAYDWTHGSMLWQISVGPGGQSINFDPSSRTAIITTTSSIEAIEMPNGRTVWQLNKNARISALDAGILYYYDPDSAQFAALEVNSQRTAWQVGIDTRPGTVVLNLTVLGDLLVVATNKGLVALDREGGQQLWNFDRETDFLPPVELNGILYVRVPASNRIYAISHQNGRILGYLKLGNPQLVYQPEYSKVYVSRGVLIFSADSTIYSYHYE